MRKGVVRYTSPGDEPEMVLVSLADAEWLTHWRERCEVGQVILKWFWRTALGLIGLLGAIGLAVNNWLPIIRGHG